MTTAFASRADLEEKQISFEQLSEHCWAYTAEGDPNSGVIITPDGVIVLDATATPVMAQGLIDKIRTVTQAPIKYVVLSHYHAVRVLGASAFKAQDIIASRGTYDLIVERGAQDWKSEYERFPRLFNAADSIPGLTWPTIVFERQLTLHLGGLEVQIIHPGKGHTAGDTIAWVPSEKVLFSGDLVEYNAGVYTGDAHLTEWPTTLEALAQLKPHKLVPGRGPAMQQEQDCAKAIEYTRLWITTLLQASKDAIAQGMDLKQAFALTRERMDPIFGQVFIYEHCLPFDVTRAYDEASGIAHPRIWTAERDQQMWDSLQS